MSKHFCIDPVVLVPGSPVMVNIIISISREHFVKWRATLCDNDKFYEVLSVFSPWLK